MPEIISNYGVGFKCYINIKNITSSYLVNFNETKVRKVRNINVLSDKVTHVSLMTIKFLVECISMKIFSNTLVD